MEEGIGIHNPIKRKLAAIMFTDIVGFTELMGADEYYAFDLIHRNQEIHRSAIQQYNGVLVKEIGDGMLSCFDLPSDAVRCAVQIQNECHKQKIPLRVGIHEGEVIIEDGDLFGDGVNIASRLEADSVMGEILISQHVYSNVKNKSDINVEYFDDRYFKNVNEVVRVYRVLYDHPNSDTRSLDYKPYQSIAVLPFFNLSSDPEQEYFCDGVTEEIINSLSHLSNLKVIARTSAFMYKNKNEDLRKVGRELNVKNILEGSIRKAGDRIRITAQLINVSDGTHIWSERFDRNLDDVFEIQDEISLSIVDKLKVKLLGEEQKRVLDVQTRSVEAYNFYLKGQFEWYKRTNEGMTKSMELYGKALEIDPNYILAHIGIANAYNALCDWGVMKPSIALPKAKNILDQALIKNGSVADLYASYAYLNMCEWNTGDYAENYKKALELNPNLAVIHHFNGLMSALLGHFEESFKSNKKAREFDPFSLIFNFAYGFFLYLSGDFSKSLNQLHYTLSIDGRFNPAILISALCYIQMGQYRYAVNEYKRIVLQSKNYDSVIPELDLIVDREGEVGFIQWLIDKGLEYYRRPFNIEYYRAALYCKLEMYEEAFLSLEKLYSIRSFRLTAIYTDNFFDPIRNDKRFIDILNRIGMWGT